MPRLAVVEPLRRWAAPSWRRKLRASIAERTRSAVSAATPDSRLTTRDTVLRLTRARRATSTIVGRAAPRPRGGWLVRPTTGPRSRAAVGKSSAWIAERSAGLGVEEVQPPWVDA